MSWIVARLLMETVKLKEHPDFESDDYNNLLVIEQKIESMKRSNLLEKDEEQILSLIREGYLFGDIGEMIGMGTETVSKTYRAVCGRIAYSLGGEFTDEGYLQAVAKNRHLSEEQVSILKNFINSSLRHKVLRRPSKSNEKTISN